ncbi:hypothetical protein QUB60_00555 [Microcoleus sp. A2-C5]|uniref:hypothetical protein n=1 Tax=unclassified Microcoleus TaxID=2642155 RepID=UPI002FD56531
MTDDICWRAIAPVGFCRSSAIGPAVILWLVFVCELFGYAIEWGECGSTDIIYYLR